MLQIRRVCDDPVCVHDEVNISIKAKVKIPGNYIQRRNARSSSLFYNFVLSAESNLELSSPARWYATLFIFCVCVCVHSGLPYSFSGWSGCPPVSVITASG